MQANTTIRKSAELSGENWKRALKNIFPFVGLVIIIVFFSIVTNGKLLDLKNILRMITQALPLIVGTLGAAFVFSQNVVDMSMGSILGLSAACAAYVSHLSTGLGIVTAIAVGAAVGLINGILYGILKINPLISTMAVSFIIRGMLQPFCDYGSVGISKGLRAFNTNQFKITAVIILIIVAYYIFEHTPVGRRIKFVGASETVSKQSGLSVSRLKIIGYVISGAAAGAAGLLTLLRSGAALPATGNLFEFDAVIALVIGGMPITGGVESRIKSAVLGSLMLTVLSSGMTMWGIEEYPQQIAKGIIFIVVLATAFIMKKPQR